MNNFQTHACENVLVPPSWSDIKILTKVVVAFKLWSGWLSDKNEASMVSILVSDSRNIRAHQSTHHVSKILIGVTSCEVTEVPPAKPKRDLLFPRIEVKILNLFTELVLFWHTVDLGSILKHSIRCLKSVDSVAWELLLHEWVVSAGAFHAKPNVLSLSLDCLWEISEADSLCHLASLGQFSLVDVLVVTGFSQSIFRLGVFEHLDSPRIVWFVEFFSQASKNVSHLFDVDHTPSEISFSVFVFEFD